MCQFELHIFKSISKTKTTTNKERHCLHPKSFTLLLDQVSSWDQYEVREKNETRTHNDGNKNETIDKIREDGKQHFFKSFTFQIDNFLFLLCCPHYIS